MQNGIVRRPRLPGGGFGEPEKIMGGETQQEKIDRIEGESAVLLNALASLFEEVQELKGSATSE